MTSDKFDPLSAQRAIFESQLSPTERLVALALLNHWARTTATYPSLRRLAEWTGYDRSTTQRAIASLRNKGAIEATEHPGRSTIYNLEPLLALPKRVEPVAENDRSQRTTGRRERPHRSQKATTPVAQCDDTGLTVRPEVIHRSDPEKKSKEVIRSLAPRSEPARTPSRRSSSKEPNPHAAGIRDHWVAEMRRLRNVPAQDPILAPGQWPRAMKAFGELADVAGPASARDVITRALSTPWHRQLMPWQLLADRASILGRSQPMPTRSQDWRQSGGEGVQVSTSDDYDRRPA